MTDKQIEILILKHFNEMRPNSSKEFNREHFMDFLTDPAHPKNTIKNSFRGVRRYYNFMNKLEIEFKICFGLPDLDRYYSLDKLIKKVKERIGKERGNKMIIERRLDEKDKYYFEIGTIATLSISTYIFGFNFITTPLIILGIIVCWWIISSKIQNRRHNKIMANLLLKAM